jgi:hypothetical protein
MTWKSPLLIDEQSNERTANRGQYNTISWHGSCNWDFDLIQVEGEQYVLAGVCWRPPEWILEVGLQSRKTIKSAQSMRSQKWIASRPGEPQDCDQAAQERVHSRTRHRSAMALTAVYYANYRSVGNSWWSQLWKYLDHRSVLEVPARSSSFPLNRNWFESRKWSGALCAWQDIQKVSVNENWLVRILRSVQLNENWSY